MFSYNATEESQTYEDWVYVVRKSEKDATKERNNQKGKKEKILTQTVPQLMSLLFCHRLCVYARCAALKHRIILFCLTVVWSVSRPVLLCPFDSTDLFYPISPRCIRQERFWLFIFIFRVSDASEINSIWCILTGLCLAVANVLWNERVFALTNSKNFIAYDSIESTEHNIQFESSSSLSAAVRQAGRWVHHTKNIKK